MSDEYAIARHSTDDMTAVAELHNQVFDAWGGQAREQLRWKYVENPFVDRVPVMTATHDDDVVGMLGMMPQELTVNGKRTLAFQAADAAVHPDHRRNGLLSRLFESFLSFADSTDAKLCTGFTNEAATRAFVKQGWTRMERDRYVSLAPAISSPASPGDLTAYLNSLLALGHAGVVGTISAVAGWVARARAEDGWTVERFDTPPVERLADLYVTGVPAQAHATRSERFYSWRLNEPVNEFTTYVLFDERSDLACGIITSEKQGTVLFRDVVPLEGADPTQLFLLVDQVLSDRTDADRFVALDGFSYTRALLGNGFLPPSLNPFTPTTRTFITRPLADDAVHGLDITASEHWSPLHIERDF